MATSTRRQFIGSVGAGALALTAHPVFSPAAHHNLTPAHVRVAVGFTEILKACDDVFLDANAPLVVAELRTKRWFPRFRTHTSEFHRTHFLRR